MNSPIITDPRWQLITTSRYFYQQGWMLGTAGNLSARLPDGSFWITASGRSKGELLPAILNLRIDKGLRKSGQGSRK